MKLIKLTFGTVARPGLIDADAIECITKDDDRTMIITASGREYYVKETTEQIVELMRCVDNEPKRSQ